MSSTAPLLKEFMKPQSKTAVFSDCECPYCSGTINYDGLYKYFWEGTCPLNFEYQCPHCRNSIDVEVESIPAFKFGEAVEHTLAGGLACTCAKVRFYPDENVFDEACPIHGTQAAKA